MNFFAILSLIILPLLAKGQPKCTSDCRCDELFGGCPQCTSNCRCEGGGCLMPSCKSKVFEQSAQKMFRFRNVQVQNSVQNNRHYIVTIFLNRFFLNQFQNYFRIFPITWCGTKTFFSQKHYTFVGFEVLFFNKTSRFARFLASKKMLLGWFGDFIFLLLSTPTRQIVAARLYYCSIHFCW